MPRQVICPSCRRPQVPQEQDGRLVCPDCGSILPVSLPTTTGAADLGGLSSALDVPPATRPASIGAMTLLRNDLRSEEPTKNGGGWMDNIRGRRGKITAPEPDGSAVRTHRESLVHAVVPEPVATEAEHHPTSAASSTPLPASERPTRQASPEITRSSIRSESQVSIPWLLTGLSYAVIVTLGLLQGQAAWADAALLATIGILGVSLLAVVAGPAFQKVLWQGFALFGGGYLALAFLPWLPHQVGAELPTTRLMTLIHARATTSPIETRDSFAILKDRSPAPASISSLDSTAGTPDLEPRTVSAGFFAPGSVRQFLVVGQCLFTILAGLIGSGIAYRFSRSEQAAG